MSSHALDYYSLLGIASNASTRDVKAAYRRKAMQLHPDRNPEGAESGHKAFKAVTEAYECLKDPSRRASYDDLRQGLPQQADWASYSASARPGQSEDDAFDEMFRRFWAKHEREFRDFSQAEEEMRHSRSQAQYMARAAAWEQEKAEAVHTKARAERVRLRTENARAARHAESMRRFWQTRPGVTWQDAALLGIFAGGMYGLLLAWSPATPPPPVAAGATAAAGSPGTPAAVTSAPSSMTQDAPITPTERL